MIKIVTRGLVKSIANLFDEIKKNYRFDFALYRVARRNISVKPPLMPIFMSWLFDKKQIPMPKDIEKIAKSHSDYRINGHERYDFTPEQVLKARSWLIWTGGLREVDVMLRLSAADPKGIVEKDYDADLSSGATDLFYTRGTDSKRFALAVTHQGDDSDFYTSDRKKSKRAEGVIVLMAPNNKSDPGLHLVLEEDIQNLLQC